MNKLVNWIKYPSVVIGYWSEPLFDKAGDHCHGGDHTIYTLQEARQVAKLMMEAADVLEASILSSKGLFGCVTRREL